MAANYIVFCQSITELERTMLSQDIPIPVYFLVWERELQSIISNVDVLTATNGNTDSKKETAADGIYNWYRAIYSCSNICKFDKYFAYVAALFNSVFAMGYQIVVNAPKPNPMLNAHIPVLQVT